MEFNVSQMTEEELRAVIAECEKEMQKRRRQLREKLINDFEKAFCALRENGIVVQYSDYEQETYRLYLDQLDNFDFSD